jgi:hypothetical protein
VLFVPPLAAGPLLGASLLIPLLVRSLVVLLLVGSIRVFLLFLLRGITIVQADSGGEPTEQAAQYATP